MNAPVVLAGPGESLSGIECVRSLVAGGYRVVVYTHSRTRIPLDLERGVSVVRVPDPQRDVDAAVAALQRLRDEVDVILPLDDIAVALRARMGDRSDATAVTAGPTGPRAQVALDKRRQLEAAGSAGFAVPPTVHLDSADDLLAELPGDLRLPVVVKPALAVEEHGGKLVRPAGGVCTTLADVQRAAAAASPSTPRMVQPLIEGVGVGVFGLAVDGRARALSGHQRVRMMNPSGSGASACRSRALDPDELRSTEELCRALEWSSLFMVELLQPLSGPAAFMELNGRAWGSMALARRHGFEYARWAVDEALGRSPREDLPRVLVPAGPEHLVARHAGRELVHLGAVLRSGRRGPGWPTRAGAARSVLRVSRSDAWYNLEPGGSRRVFLADTWRTVSSQVRGRAPGPVVRGAR